MITQGIQDITLTRTILVVEEEPTATTAPGMVTEMVDTHQEDVMMEDRLLADQDSLEDMVNKVEAGMVVTSVVEDITDPMVMGRTVMMLLCRETMADLMVRLMDMRMVVTEELEIMESMV